MNITDNTSGINGPFEFIAGALSLCLVDTLGGRGGVLRERLRSGNDFRAWIKAAGFGFGAGIEIGQVDLSEVLELREAIYGACQALVAGDLPKVRDLPRARDLEIINRFALGPSLRPQIGADGNRVFVAKDPFTAVLSSLAEDAIDLLSGEYRSRIRICSGCQMVFVDKSRPGRRRWCSSVAGCGNKAKMQARRQRTKASQNPQN